jgi:hypothetical protein
MAKINPQDSPHIAQSMQESEQFLALVEPPNRFAPESRSCATAACESLASRYSQCEPHMR